MQVIGYWDLNEKQTYEVTKEKYRVQHADTTQRELVKYEVDITIVDSTASSYTIEWVYRHIDQDSENEFEKKLAGISNNRKVIIKTSEMGAFQEVVNWQELRDEIKGATGVVRKEFKHIPKIDLVIDKVEAMFLTKEAIESMAIKDIQQFYSFHGAVYTLGEEVSGQLQVPNNYGGEPFNSDASLILDELNVEDNNGVIWMWQTIDSKALTDATYSFLKESATAAGNKFPERKDFPSVQSKTTTAARIHGSGWLVYSRETKEVTADGALAFEERTIEIK